MSKRLEDYADEQAQAKFRENQELARQLRAARAEARSADGRLAELKARLELHEALDEAKLAPPEWLTPKKAREGHAATVGLIYADAHTGEVVDPAAVDGINAYNPDISKLRHERFFTKAVVLARDYLAGVSYDGCVLFSTGDAVTGLIHEELEKTNSETVLESILIEAEYQEAGISMLAEEFGKVHVVVVPGNHGRYKKGKPEHKNYVRNNFDWFIGKLVAKEFKSDDRVTFMLADAPDAHVQVYGTRFLVTHGNQFRGGSGISGALAPLMLGSHRKTRRQSAAGRPYDVMVMGHFHQRIYLPSRGVLAGGCMKGYDEFAYDNNFEPEEPSQEAFLITPERGITFNWPVQVASRKREGW